MIQTTIHKQIILSIFGASGDLAKLKIFPAIYEMAMNSMLPEDFFLFGYGRTSKERSEFIEEFLQSIKESQLPFDKEIAGKLSDKIFYFSGNYDSTEDFSNYRKYIDQIVNNIDFAHIAYFSVPPFIFQSIAENLANTRKSPTEDIRLIIEKPFGGDKKTARDLYHFINRFFHEDQIFLLDHYLGKDEIDNLLHMRHANRILNSMIKGSEVANIQITASESIGVENRVSYFERVGIIKDFVQSHLLQILTLTTMHIPVSKESSSIQREKNAILSALTFPKRPNNIVIGQYSSYKDHDEVNKTSNTSTFAALRIMIDREDWYQVPIYIRVGKKLKRKHMYIVIELKKFGFQKDEHEPNRVMIELQPNSRITIQLLDKISKNNYQTLKLSTDIPCDKRGCLSAHTVLLMNAFINDRSRFLSFSEVLSSWDLIDKIEKYIIDQKIEPIRYEDGSEGPDIHRLITENDNFEWYDC